jgi:hypothetical protein
MGNIFPQGCSNASNARAIVRHVRLQQQTAYPEHIRSFLHPIHESESRIGNSSRMCAGERGTSTTLPRNASARRPAHIKQIPSVQTAWNGANRAVPALTETVESPGMNLCQRIVKISVWKRRTYLMKRVVVMEGIQFSHVGSLAF